MQMPVMKLQKGDAGRRVWRVIRLSVGIEDEVDLWHDLAQALEGTAVAPSRAVGAAGAPSDTILR